EEQSSKVDWVVDARWVESGKMFTSSGVSAGTDMALGLIAKIYGRQVAHELAESLEYTWHEMADVDPFAVFVNRLKADEAQGPAELLKTEPISNGSVATAPNYLRLYFNKRPL